MAYDVELAERLRTVLAGEPGVTEKRMFGGLAFLVDGRLAVGAGSGGALMLRVDPAEADRLVGEPHVAALEMRGGPVAGWLLVGADATRDDDALRRWVTRGVARARTMPPR